MNAALSMELRLLDAAAVAGRLCCSVSFVHKERAAGRLRASIKLGTGEKGWRYTEEDVQLYIASRSMAPNAISAEEVFIPIYTHRNRYTPTKSKTTPLHKYK